MTDEQMLQRRRLVKSLLAALVAAPAAALLGCGAGSSDSTTASSTDNSGSDPTSDSGSTTDAASDNSGWARGGTAAIATNFPPVSPFTAALGSVCALTASYTLGPCYFNPDHYREDISEGQLGVPVILALRLVDSQCRPIAGADVDIWHCSATGLYSGDSADSSDAGSFNSGFCTDNDASALAGRWFRGIQTTDSDGIVYFKTCFPGWYPGRTTHIHFQIRHNNRQSLVSQFCFEDALSNDIYLNHGDYTGQAKDTLNSRDNVFDSDYADYQFATARNDDGSMLAWKTIQISG